MSRSRTSTRSALRLAAALAALLAALIALPDRAGAVDPGEDLPPIVSNGIVNPSGLPYLGGSVTISADVVDDVGVTSVSAEIYGSDGSVQSVPLIATGPTTYSGVVAIGANFTDEPVSHGVSVQASDTNGATTFEAIGDVQVDAQPQFDEAPAVSDPSVEPRELPAAGGTVTIGVTATDNRGISSVEAAVTLPDGSSVAVLLEPISFSRFEGTFTAPANGGTSVQTYAVEIFASDDIGQQVSVNAGTFSVAAGSPCRARRRGLPPHAHASARGCGRTV